MTVVMTNTCPMGQALLEGKKKARTVNVMIIFSQSLVSLQNNDQRHEDCRYTAIRFRVMKEVQTEVKSIINQTSLLFAN